MITLTSSPGTSRGEKTHDVSVLTDGAGVDEPTWPQWVLLRQIDLYPQDPALTIVRLIRVDGEVDKDRLVRAVDRVLRNEPGIAMRMARTASGWRRFFGAHPLQACRLVEIGDDPDRQAKLMARDRQGSAMEVDRSPLVQVELLISHGMVTHILVRASHLVWDAQTGVLVMQRLSEVYAGHDPYAKGDQRAAGLEPSHADRDRAVASYDFFASAFDGLVSFGHERMPNRRDANGRLPGRRVEVIVDGELGIGAGRLCHDHHLPPSALFMAISALFQARLLDTESVVVGCPVSTRTSPEDCGYHVNTLPVRLTVREGMNAVELVRTAHASIIECLRRRDVDYSLTGVQPGVGTLASCFTFQGEEPSAALGNATVTPAFFPSDFVSFPLSIVASAFRSVDGLGYRFVVEVGRWADGIDIASALRSIVEQVVARPSAPLGEIGLVGVSEYDSGMNSLVEPRIDDAPDMVTSFRRQAEQAPGRVALIAGERKVTYGQLDDRTDRLAAAIHHRWPSATHVVICHSWGVDEVSAVVGVLKSGKAHVPVDPDLMLRVPSILEDLGRVPIIGDAHTSQLLTAQGMEAVSLDELESAQPVSPRRTQVHGDDPAYVIFTSGSTGRPKGVEVSHRALSTFIRGWRRFVPCEPGDIHLRTHHLAFDASVIDILTPLASGAAVHLPDQEEIRDAQRFADVLVRSRATCLLMTPSFADQVQAFLPQDGAPDLRTTLMGAEAVPAAVASNWAVRVGNPRHRIMNVYGPTEATVICVAGEATAADLLDRDGLVPLGYPLDQAGVAVVDSAGRRVPQGVIGELVVSGPCLANGYLNRAELTRRAFVTDLRGLPGRWYKTGDLVRVNPDGRFDFLGRVDDQVKVGGYRIELGEVSSALRRVSGASSVVAFVDPKRPTRLVAAVVTTDDSQIQHWRAAMRQVVPWYMVPERIVTVFSALPMNVNGKVDVAALAALAEDVKDAHLAEGVMILDPVEAHVHDAVSQVIGSRDFTCSENLFDIGVTSLSLADLFDRLHSGFPDVNLAMVDLFQHPTVESIAARIRRDRVPSDAETEDAQRTRELDRQRRRDRDLQRRAQRRRNAHAEREGETEQ